MEHVTRVTGEPEYIVHDNESGGGYWTVPLGYKHPSCPGCGHKYWEMKPRRSVGGASVPGPLCNWCHNELQRM